MAPRKMSKKASKKRSKKRMSCPKGTVVVKGYTRADGKRVSRHCSKVGKRRTKSKSKSKSPRRKSSVRAKLMGFDGISYRLSRKKSKGSKKASRKYKFIGIDDKN